MTVLERGSVADPMVRKETAEMTSLGGEVVLRSMDLAEILALKGTQVHLRDQLPGESKEEAHARAGASIVAKTLAATVLLADGKPMWTEAQWNTHGATHVVEVMGLYAKVNTLSAQDVEAAAKN